MTKIVIDSIASLKRALAQPGLAVILDENTYRAPTLQRDEEAMRIAGLPRKIVGVKGDSFCVERADGKKVYQDFPGRDGLVTSGDNSFSIVSTTEDGKVDRLTYRLVDPSEPYEPSRLVINHPMIDPAVIDREREEKNRLISERQDRIVAAKARMDAVRNAPAIAPEPEYAVLESTMKTVIRDSLVALKREGKYLGMDQLMDILVASPIVHEADFSEFEKGENLTVPRSLLQPEASALLDEAYYELASKPRGSWREYQYVDEAGAPVPGSGPSALVSLGNGSSLDIAAEDGVPFDTDFFAKKMMQYEGYRFLEKVQSEMALEEANEKLARFNFTVGNVYQDMTIGGHRFSKVTITDVERNDKGDISVLSLSMSKRGSKKTWTGQVKATDMAETLDLLHPVAAQKPETVAPARPAIQTPLPGF